MADVTLSAAVRNSLLSLQNTTGLIERTQSRLSKGMRVASAIDDPVAYFQAKSLNDRASDFTQKKESIDQGVSTVSAALDGVEKIESLVKQMKGLAQSMKSATTSQLATLVSQFNDLRSQINNMAADSTYQGTNLINGTGQTLTVEFSEKTASILTINSVNLQAGTAGLSISSAAAYTGNFIGIFGGFGTGEAQATTANTMAKHDVITVTQDFTVTWHGGSLTFNGGETVGFTYGTGTSLDFIVGSAGLTVTAGKALTVDITTAGATTTGDLYVAANTTRNLVVSYTAVGTGVHGTAMTAGEMVTLTYQGSTPMTLTTADTVNFSFTAGAGGTSTLVVEAGSTLTLTQGTTFTFEVTSSGTGNATTSVLVWDAGATCATTTVVAISSVASNTSSNVEQKGLYVKSTAGITGSLNSTQVAATSYVRIGDTTTMNALITQMDSALTTLRTQAQVLGTNVALLSNRLDFTTQYVSTLEKGAGKLTLANSNEESANLLALQTRQQLGIQSLSLAAQSESSVLQLFR